jgi:hypothetical protein
MWYESICNPLNSSPKYVAHELPNAISTTEKKEANVECPPMVANVNQINNHPQSEMSGISSRDGHAKQEIKGEELDRFPHINDDAE